MKKNNIMRLACVVLVLTLLSTCVISGTFAKYVTDDSADDTARVAKFGVAIDPKGALFLEDYAKDDDTYTVGANTVESSDTWKLVAPGTTKSNEEVVITGTPEVATRVTYDATITVSDNWKVGTDEYFPIIFTVEGTELKIDHANDETIAAFLGRVETAIENCKADYAPNTNLATVSDDFPSVTWTWEFEGEATGAKLAGYQTDEKDTALGDAAAVAAADAEIDITVAIATTVTQID